jgi:LppX_LprAFG lipoprotein
MSQRKMDNASVFATVAIGAAALAMVVMIAAAFGAFRSDGADASAPEDEQVADDDAVADPNARATEVVDSAANAMAGVTSVEFRLHRDGAPIFIDEFERIALNSLRGQFSVPGKAQAELEVTVNDNLATRLGAVAVDDEVWISNPVTGDFETLPAGYDIDPSKFFDPENGWRPLLANLQDVTMVGVDDRGGERYHITGMAPAEQVSDITVGLVQGQDVAVDFWIHPDTYLVTAAEFETTIDGSTSDWNLELDHYGDTFTIEPPANVRDTPDQSAPDQSSEVSSDG